MSSPTDTTGEHRVCTRCVELHRQIRANDMQHAAELRRLSEELSFESDVNAQSTKAVALITLLLVVVGAGLWAIGRLAVAIGGAS